MEEKEISWDRLLKIKTMGRDDSQSDQYKYPYEPTSYSVLERLANSGMIRKKNVFMDYGCGKGRADIFMSYQTRCRSIGLEYDERIYKAAMDNRKKSVVGKRVEFVKADAISYELPIDVDRIFFFNPFSVEVLQKTFARIMDSYYRNQREILLFFYYPSDEYVSFLMTQDELMFTDEIDCRDLFPGNNKREKILIFEIV